MADVQATTTRDQGTGIAGVALVVGLELVVVAMWLGYDAIGVELAARTGSQTQQVSLTAVAVTTAVVTVLAAGLRRLLGRRENGLRTWRLVAAVVWAASFLGPLGAASEQAGL